ncbi:MAG: carboxypeptidase regulatory-like domain-containing protein [Acidobacteria bacterium]|nr:carboxypeptidase regulatory-like domain-containing protein [Acidobacteriota bacterium]
MRKLLPILIIFLFTIAGLITVQAQESDDKSTLKGIINGRIVDGNGQPMNNVMVSTKAVVQIIDSAPVSTTTDEQGHFQLDGLTAGNYTINASFPGYVIESKPSNKETYYRVGDNNVEITMIKGGAINGIITAGSNNEPVIGLPVTYVYLKDLDGKVRKDKNYFSQRAYTDDRGIYRLYGLRPGEYLVRVGGSSPYSIVATAFDDNQQLYYPGTPRAQAKSITVHSGEEINGIDIRYRKAAGYQITGTINADDKKLKTDENVYSIRTNLVDSDSKLIADFSQATIKNDKLEFKFFGVASGNYDLYAEFIDTNTKEHFLSLVKHLQIKNTDVSGITLTLNRVAAINGQVIRKKLDEKQLQQLNKTSSKLPYAEIIIKAQNSVTPKEYNPSSPELIDDIVPDSKGNFTIDNVHAGLYFLSLYLSNKNWYLDAITQGDESKPQQQIEQLNKGITVKDGNGVTKLNVKVAEGAGKIQGQINKENNKSLPPLTVHLIPIDKELVDNLLRYYQTDVDASGNFLLENIAPGKYWAIALPHEISAKADEKNISTLETNVAWNDTKRSALRRTAETANYAIEVKFFETVDNVKLAISNIKKEPSVKSQKSLKK